MGDIYQILFHLRIVYDLFLEQPGDAKLKAISKQGTIEGCLKEVREQL